MIEVELKAMLGKADCHENHETRTRILGKGFNPGACLVETDTYFSAPDRDFRETDEALRIRSAMNLSDSKVDAYVTYKGKKLDGISKTRKEYETGIDDPDTMRKLLEVLGYKAVHTVRKKRWYFTKGDYTACIDEVEGLGCFLELEKIVDAEDDRNEVVENLMTLLGELGIDKERLTRKSYLELLNP
ncbi:MAG: class IV adenylate cyclase [Clostridiales bacterium]|nr:class IV adenylate cyclase [Clostridiales bacterium]